MKGEPPFAGAALKKLEEFCLTMAVVPLFPCLEL